MSNWKNTSIQKAAVAVRNALRGTHQSDFVLAKSLKLLRGALKDGEFIKFAMDHKDGLAVAQATAYKFERMVSVVTIIQTEKVWERVGWEGTSKVAKIADRNERVSVCRAITKEKNPVGKQGLVDLLETHAPSYSAQRGSRQTTTSKSKTRMLREIDTLKSTMTMWLAKYPVLKRDMSDEVEVILGLEGGQIPKAG